ncbi:MAG: pyruvate kinase [Proteobacteria bacterium]|nr:pyruvate kinase [Pseudomonadota bacterium]
MIGEKRQRKTKLVGTIGPASSTPEVMARLIRAGLDVARLNFAHGEAEENRRTIRRLRRVAAEVGRDIAILQDLGGPKIRLGILPEGERRLEVGQDVVLAAGDAPTPEALPVDYPYLDQDVSPGDRILLADGLVELEVRSVEAGRVICHVLVGGEVSSRKGVNLPTSKLRVPAFTDKDRADLTIGLEEGVDMVAMSFVRSAEDLQPVKTILDQRGPLPHRPLLIAKIEKPEAARGLEDILAQVDAVMVARGDLGVEMALEQVPLIQKQIIAAARGGAKPVIVATQMLRSMVDSPRPTRAEAADVAGAVFEGTDALMLSEETATGRYPVESVAMLDRIARAIEPNVERDPLLDEPPGRLLPLTEAAISRAACVLARDVGAAAIVATTTSGSSARLVARFRPTAPIVGLTAEPAAARQLRLSYGVIPALVERFEDSDEMFARAAAWAREMGLAADGDRLIVTGGLPINTPGTTNLVKVIEV